MNLRKVSKILCFEIENSLYDRCHLIINCSSNLVVLDKKPLHLLTEISILHDSNFECICRIFSYPLTELKRLSLVALSLAETTFDNIGSLLKNCLNLESLSITGPKDLFQRPYFLEKDTVFRKLHSLCVCICYCTNDFLVDFVSRCPVLNVLLSHQNSELNRDLMLSLHHQCGINLNILPKGSYSDYKFVVFVNKVDNKLVK